MLPPCQCRLLVPNPSQTRPSYSVQVTGGHRSIGQEGAKLRSVRAEVAVQPGRFAQHSFRGFRAARSVERRRSRIPCDRSPNFADETRRLRLDLLLQQIQKMSQKGTMSICCWLSSDGGEDVKLSFNGYVPAQRYAYPLGGINLTTAVAKERVACKCFSGVAALVQRPLHVVFCNPITRARRPVPRWLGEDRVLQQAEKEQTTSA